MSGGLCIQAPGNPVTGVEGQPDENVREVHFLSGQTSKENEDFVYSFR